VFVTLTQVCSLSFSQVISFVELAVSVFHDLLLLQNYI
jgi:hypothetical protein